MMTPTNLRQLLGVFLLGTLISWPASAVRADYGDVLTIQLVLDSATLAARNVATGDTVQIGIVVGDDSNDVYLCPDPCAQSCPSGCDCSCEEAVPVDTKNRATATKVVTQGPPASDTSITPPEHLWMGFWINGEFLSPPIRLGHSMTSSISRSLNGDIATHPGSMLVSNRDNLISPVVHITANPGRAEMNMWRSGGFQRSTGVAVGDSLPSVTLSAGTSTSALYLRNLSANQVMQVNDAGLIFPDGSVQTSASGGGGGGWLDAGSTVRLQDSTNSVVIGASTTTGHKLNVEGGISGIRSKGTSIGTAQTFNGLEIYHEHTGPGPGTGWGSSITFRQMVPGSNRQMASLNAKRDGSDFRSRLEWTAYDGITARQMVLTADGFVGIGTTTPSQALHVAGNICATGTIGACSDLRFKKDVESLPNALESVARLRGVTFTWRRDEFPDCKFSEQRQLGFIAQEVREVAPSLVSLGSDGYYSVDYARVAPLLVEAVKAQQQEIEELRRQILELRAFVESEREPGETVDMALSGPDPHGGELNRASHKER